MIGYGNSLGVYLLNPYIYGGAAFTNEKSLLFDGVDETLDMTNIAELQNVQNFSISCWVKLTSASLTTAFGRYASALDGLFLYIEQGTGDINARIYNGSARYNVYNTALSIGTWYHVVMVYDGTQSTDATKLKVYLNGSSLTRTGGSSPIPTTTANTTDTFHFGSTNTAVGTESFYGDEYSIFDYSLTSGQVTSIYNSGTPTDLDNTSGVTAPVHWWRMGDGDTFPTITDVGTAGGNNGTMTNMESGDIVTDTP